MRYSKSLIAFIIIVLLALYGIYKINTPKSYITDVIDGDTIEVKLSSGKRQRVRLIGVNTPEIGECYSEQATEYLAQFIGREVSLVKDRTQGNRGVYGRVLRHVYINDTYINYSIIRQGYGEFYLFNNTPSGMHDDLVKAGVMAQHEMAGLWGECK